MIDADPDPVVVTRSSYGVLADAYAATTAVTRPELAAWRDAWAATLPGRGRVLDAGCGPGQHAAAFAAAGLRAVALDLTPAMAALARARVPAVVGDLRRLAFADGAFAGVWSSASLLHVPRDDAGTALRELRRVTADGGALALITATGGTDGWESPQYDTGPARPPPRFFVYHDEASLRTLLTDAGWAVRSVRFEPGELRDWLWVTADAAG